MDSVIEDLTAKLCAALAEKPEQERIDLINQVRTRVHEISPLRDHPVDLVLWVASDSVKANNYNPNVVAPPEMKLLEHSIRANGYTMPIVAHDNIDCELVVDGFHRHRIGKEAVDIRASVHGRLPITHIRADRADEAARIAATIEHNRARGEHAVGEMSEIVKMLHRAGWRDDKIRQELGMDEDEVLRLKQMTGLAEMFSEREFSEAWESDEIDAETEAP